MTTMHGVSFSLYASNYTSFIHESGNVMLLMQRLRVAGKFIEFQLEVNPMCLVVKETLISLYYLFNTKHFSSIELQILRVWQLISSKYVLPHLVLLHWSLVCWMKLLCARSIMFLNFWSQSSISIPQGVWRLQVRRDMHEQRLHWSKTGKMCSEMTGWIDGPIGDGRRLAWMVFSWSGWVNSSVEYH